MAEGLSSEKAGNVLLCNLTSTLNYSVWDCKSFFRDSSLTQVNFNKSQGYLYLILLGVCMKKYIA